MTPIKPTAGSTPRANRCRRIMPVDHGRVEGEREVQIPRAAQLSSPESVAPPAQWLAPDSSHKGPPPHVCKQPKKMCVNVKSTCPRRQLRASGGGIPGITTRYLEEPDCTDATHTHDTHLRVPPRHRVPPRLSVKLDLDVEQLLPEVEAPPEHPAAKGERARVV